MKVVPYKKRKVIEIYFVLYLAALILLIPGKESDKNAFTDEYGSPLFQLDFNLKAEKSTLNYVYSVDSMGVHIEKADSVNLIFHTGDVTNIRYEFIVEDLLRRNKLILSSINNSTSKFFRIEKIDNEQTAKFFWQPSFNDLSNKSYLVRVIATAIGRSGKNQGKEIRSSTQFSMNITIANQNTNLLTVQNSANDSLLISNNSQFSNQPFFVQTGNIILIPQQDIIKTIAYSRWQNIINVSGLNPKTDLLKQPTISLSKSADDDKVGNAVIKNYTENWIAIEGVAPAYGSMKVKLQLTRKYDGQEKSIEFKIENQLLGEPKFSNTMYPGINYKFEPNLPLLTLQSTKAILRTNDGKNILYSSNEGTPFWFTPSINDTGKFLEFIRYIDNNEVGQKYSIKIISFPNPVINRVSEIEKNKVRIYTTSYGIYNGSENIITKIEIVDGNIKAREIIGQKVTQNDKMQHQQVFEIINTNPNSTFSFKIRAISSNGTKSSLVNYP